jgi:hypothetical protein
MLRRCVAPYSAALGLRANLRTRTKPYKFLALGRKPRSERDDISLLLYCCIEIDRRCVLHRKPVLSMLTKCFPTERICATLSCSLIVLYSTSNCIYNWRSWSIIYFTTVKLYIQVEVYTYTTTCILEKWNGSYMLDSRSTPLWHIVNGAVTAYMYS